MTRRKRRSNAAASPASQRNASASSDVTPALASVDLRWLSLARVTWIGSAQKLDAAATSIHERTQQQQQAGSAYTEVALLGANWVLSVLVGAQRGREGGDDDVESNARSPGRKEE
ncbi:hypothetical protein MTO96_010497 [Rhipicephalus appendiculatus]